MLKAQSDMLNETEDVAYILQRCFTSLASGCVLHDHHLQHGDKLLSLSQPSESLTCAAWPDSVSCVSQIWTMLHIMLVLQEHRLLPWSSA